jgi:hypothetical protein
MSDAWVNVVALAILLGSPVLALGVGVAYFVKAGKGASLAVRLLSSAFGPSVALMYPIAGIFWPERYRYTPSGVQVYYWLQLIPLVLLAFALARYPGNRRLHVVLVPLGLLAWAGTFAWGWLFVHGE